MDDATGQATRELTPFRTVLGVDPSAKMVEQARASTQSPPPPSSSTSDSDSGAPGGTSTQQDTGAASFAPTSTTTSNAGIPPIPGQISYIQSAAEELSFLEDGSVDMIVSGASLSSLSTPNERALSLHSK